MLYDSEGNPLKPNGHGPVDALLGMKKPPVDDRPLVAFCWPTQDEVKARFFMSMVALVYSSRVKPILLRGASSVVSVARNSCIEKMQSFEKMGAGVPEWTFWIDSDMEVPPDALMRLIAHGKDIVGATYVRRAPPYDVMGRTLHGGPSEDIKGGLMEVAGLPLGCLLIRRKVFDDICKDGRPPFYFGQDDLGRDVGEDYTFCKRARDAGYSVWVDIDLTKEVKHIGEWAFSPQEAGGPDKDGNVIETKFATLGEPQELVHAGTI